MACWDMHVHVIHNFPEGMGLSVTPLFKMDLFSLLRCKAPQSSEQAVNIHFKTVLLTTIKHFHEGCYRRRLTKWLLSNKSCHLDTFYCFSRRLETSSSTPEIPACTPKQLISSDLQTHTQENTPALSVSIPLLALDSASDLLSLRQQDAWMGSHSYLPPLWQWHTHNKSTLKNAVQPTELCVHVW